MKFLLIISHPNVDKSLNHLIAQTASKHLSSIKGNEVRIVDLCKNNFSPMPGPQDFKIIQNKEFFDYQAEQAYAMDNDNFVKEVKDEIENVKWCDCMMFYFPLYWWTYPAPIKGYFDRIFAYHFAYGGGKSFKGKSIMFNVTSGGNYGDRLVNLFSYDKWIGFGLKMIPTFYVPGVFAIPKDQKYFEKRRLETSEKIKKHLDENVINQKKYIKL